MDAQDLIKVLKQHNSIEEVLIDKSKDLSDVWEQYIRYVYNNGKIENLCWDSKLQDSLIDFQKADGLELVNKSGRLLKRFAHFYKTTTGEAIPDNVMGIMGDLLQNLVTSENSLKFIVDFTNNFNWEDGDFGKSGSCWWGTYSDSLPTFEQGGGWCVRFYDANHNGIGRTWLYPDPEENVLLCFNSYGIERAKVSKTIKKVFSLHGIELHYSTCSIENSHDSNIPYINGGTGFVLYTNDKNPRSEYDLDMEVVEDEEHTNCDECGSRIDRDEAEYINDSVYCNSCRDKLFSWCNKCEEFCDRDDVHEVVGSSRYSYVCCLCADNLGMSECSDCGNYSESGVFTEDSGNFFCDQCDSTFHCEQCDNNFENSNECPNCEIEEEGL